ncbi:hypothetical protein BGX38DRAFT_1232907 [Terfezia claveryi]|nr:hypothetical protein BGX38DRAFT_1232907 [Terfezia claveryi]
MTIRQRGRNAYTYRKNSEIRNLCRLLCTVCTVHKDLICIQFYLDPRPLHITLVRQGGIISEFLRYIIWSTRPYRIFCFFNDSALLQLQGLEQGRHITFSKSCEVFNRETLEGTLKQKLGNTGGTNLFSPTCEYAPVGLRRQCAYTYIST